MRDRRVLLGLLGIVIATVVASLWLAVRATKECGSEPGSAVASATMPPAGAGRRGARDSGNGTAQSKLADDTAHAGWRYHGDGALIGRVHEAVGGVPVHAATIALSAGRGGPRKPHVTRSGPDGSFEFPLVPAFDSWTLTVRASEHLAAATVPGIDVSVGATTDVGEIRLESGLAVEGLVVDEEGVPVSGALVRTVLRGPGVPLNDVRAAVRGMPETPPFSDSAETDQDGRFTLRATPPGTCDLVATAPGYGPRSLRALVVGAKSEAPLRIVLPKAATLSGQVVHRLGGSVAGLIVTAFAEDTMRNDFELVDRSFTRTDEHGAFTFDGLDARHEYWLCVTQENGIRTIAQDIEIPPEESVVIPIGGDATLTGVVTDETGSPVEGAELMFNIDPGHDAMLFVVTRSDADGAYEVDDVPVEDLDGYLVTADGFLPEPAHSMALIEQRSESRREIEIGENVFDFRLSRASVIRGVVVEQGTETPVPGVRVSLLGKNPMLDYVPTARTDAAGVFELVGDESGRSSIVLQKQGWAQVAADESAKGTKEPAPEAPALRTFEMTRSVLVRGVVLSPDGKPVTGARVTLLPAAILNDEPSEELFVLGEPARDVTDSAGRFALPGAGVGGQHAVHAFREGFLPARSPPLSSAAGVEIVGVEIRLRRPVTLQCRVTRPDGQPIAGADVEWSISPDSAQPRVERPWSMQHLKTGDDGTCRAEGLDAGKISVTVQHDRFLPYTESGIAAGEGETVRVDVVLDQGRVISGVVLGPAGEPRADATIEVKEGRRWVERKNVGTDGRLELIGEKEGTHEVRARAHGAAVSESVRATVDGPPVTLRLRPEHPIAGHVVFPDGTPAGYAHVVAYDAATGCRGESVASKLGEFLIHGLLPGTYAVSVDQGRHATPLPNLLAVTLPDVAGGTSDLRIEVRRGETVSGRVFMPDGSSGCFGELIATNLPPSGTQQQARLHAVRAAIASGTFEATGLLPGRVHLRGRVGEHRFDVVTVAGTVDLRIDLPATGAIEGRVVGLDGGAVARASVRTAGPGGTDHAVTDAEGLYRVRQLPPGKYTVRVATSIDGTPHEATVADVFVSPGQTTVVRNVRLEPTGAPLTDGPVPPDPATSKP